MTARSVIVASARTWLDTPFAHQGRTKGKACDCAGLLIGVGIECGEFETGFDVTGYARQPDGITLIGHCRSYMTEIDPADVEFGDAVLIYFDGRPQHLGLIGDYRYGGLSLIHASNSIERPRVVEHRLMVHLRFNIRAAFRYPGID